VTSSKPLPDRQTVYEALCRAERLPPDRRRADALLELARDHRHSEQEATKALAARPRRRKSHRFVDRAEDALAATGTKRWR
jgi:hypothetical protein